MYIDAHAHQQSSYTQILVGTHTLAVHPWDLKRPFDRATFDVQWEALIKTKKEVVAIGECGLDRIHEGIATIDDQIYVLMKHFELARARGLPLILHTVRAYSDLLHILKAFKFDHSIILHAYGGNEHELHELLKYPTYFCYGARLFKNDKMIKLTPPDRLLLETGDQQEYSIADIYKKAAESTGKNLGDLKREIYHNFLSCFNQLDDQSASNFIENLNRHKKT